MAVIGITAAMFSLIVPRTTYLTPLVPGNFTQRAIVKDGLEVPGMVVLIARVIVLCLIVIIA